MSVAKRDCARTGTQAPEQHIRLACLSGIVAYHEYILDLVRFQTEMRTDLCLKGWVDVLNVGIGEFQQPLS